MKFSIGETVLLARPNSSIEEGEIVSISERRTYALVRTQYSLTACSLEYIRKSPNGVCTWKDLEDIWIPEEIE